MFDELDGRKGNKEAQSIEIIRLKKEITSCKEQLEKSRNNQMNLSHKLNDSVSILKTKVSSFEEEKQQLTT